MKEALRAAREDLGPNALVLSTRFVHVPGLKGWLGRREVEVTAAAERPPVSGHRHQAAAREAATGEIAARLEAGGMEAELARDVAAAMPPDNRRGASSGAVQRALVGQLAAAAAADEDYAPIEVFIGPPGVGKTTTIAKLAAQERARGGRRLGVVAADGFRVGAVEQLRTFAEIIGSPFTVARSATELDLALDGARRPLLIDTAGRSPNDEASRDMFRLIGQRRDVRTHLVLSAASSPSSVRRAIERFRDARPSRLVLTKVDEADTLAPLLGIVRGCGLPVSYLGTGQNVPEDLCRATAATLAAWVTGEEVRAGAFA